jgi:hypothetical protein
MDAVDGVGGGSGLFAPINEDVGICPFKIGFAICSVDSVAQGECQFALPYLDWLPFRPLNRSALDHPVTCNGARFDGQ